MTRRIKLSLRALMRWLYPKILPVMFFGTWAVGVIGYLVTEPSTGPINLDRTLDAIYRSLQLFALEFGMPELSNGDEVDMNAWLQVARLAAVATASYTILALFFTSALDSIKRRVQVLFGWRDRYVLLGFGEINRAIAAQLRHDGRRSPVTAVDRSFDSVDRRLARDQGILLLEGSLSDPLTLKRARIERARRVIVSTGDDIHSVEVANAVAPMVEDGLTWEDRYGHSRWLSRIVGIRAKPQAPNRPAGQDASGQHRLRVHLADLRFSSDLTEARDMARSPQDCFRPFNIKQDAAREFVAHARLVQRARDHGRRRVHLVIAGMGTQGEAILIETLLTCYAAGLLPPKITIFDKEADEIRDRLHAHYPFLMDNRLVPVEGASTDPSEGFEPITVRQLDVARTAFNDCDVLNTLDDGIDPPTAWVFCCGDDQLNHAAALRLEIAMQTRARQPVPIHVRSWRSGISSGAPRKAHVFGFIQHFGDVRSTVAASDLLGDDGDDLAKAIHLAYQTKSLDGATPPPHDPDRGYSQNWLNLPEPVRDANRRAARSLPFKLMDLGFAAPALMAGHLGELHHKQVDRILERLKTFDPKTDGRSVSGLDQDIRGIALAEHSAWIVERATKGWHQTPDPSTGRDNSLRRQGNMKPFDDLDRAVQEYDLVALETGLRMQRTTDVEVTATHAIIGEFDLSDGFPALNDVKHLTEIRLTCGKDAAQKITTAGWSRAAKAFSTVLKAWSETPNACRVHILLDFPVYMPTVSLNNNEVARATDPVVFLTEAMDVLDDKVICDVTRTYDRVPLPKSPYADDQAAP